MRKWLILFSLLSPAVMAEQHQIGIAGYAVSVDYSLSTVGSDDLAGFAGFYTFAPIKNFAVRTGYFSMDHATAALIDVTGFDIQLLVSNNFTDPGFRIYGGVGHFREQWGAPFAKLKIRGPQGTVGIGYNFEKVSLDWWVTIRSAGGYDEFLTAATGIDPGASAASSGLMAAVRF